MAISTDDKQATEPDVAALLAELVTAQQQHRDEIAQLRQELAKSKAPAPHVGPLVLKSAEQLLEERVAEIRMHTHYCPGCGRLSKYMRECHGRSAEAPHPPIEMVSTEELLAGDPALHTPAPDTLTVTKR